ncbi:thioredoxin family protein [Litchfieldia salsa]|uniref:Thioredoxin n=1 Tax=Litchfieldia salsa TaxID=930152 RepID=A0A1H0WPN5_9BACI|nr:thioredoxin family protein [Litchfieldia salsa]SDP92629.1 Thioredoxin [Litchfieldia salsa]
MKEWTREDIEQNLSNNELTYVYLYTPMCGTCQMAKKMLEVVDELLPNLDIGQCNLNYLPEKAREWEIESVPCLLTFSQGQMTEKIYAFKSVDYLYSKLKAN